MNFKKSGLLLLLAAFSQPLLATTDVLYITNGDSRDIQAIQGNMIIAENLNTPVISGNPRHYGIAVRESIWTFSYNGGVPSILEFDSGLNPTGNTGTFDHFGSAEAIDGATDGVYNYTMDDLTGEIYRYNGDWSGSPTLMFTSACSNWCPGITYDPVNQSIWTADDVNINEYSMTGQFRGSFPHNDRAGALAHEPSTDTLWLVDNQSRNTLYQFSKNGTLLDTVTTTSIYSNNVWGAEFQMQSGGTVEAVPSLSRWGMIFLTLFLVIAAFFGRRRALL